MYKINEIGKMVTKFFCAWMPSIVLFGTKDVCMYVVRKYILLFS